MMQGQIIEGRGGLYTVRDAAGIDHVLRAKKKFRRQHMTPLVGDRVDFTPGEGDEHGWLEEILPRKNQLLRPAAEYDNYRKRSQREADQKFNDGVSHAVTQILGILDTLDMAANAACTDENYKKGVMMTLDKAAKALETLNITEIEALNQPFDPNFMNAVQQVPAAEGQESGSVVQVFQKGYKIGDKIIRHAMVVVAE